MSKPKLNFETMVTDIVQLLLRTAAHLENLLTESRTVTTTKMGTSYSLTLAVVLNYMLVTRIMIQCIDTLLSYQR